MTTIVAIDGPAGAGKSTIARNVARELGYQLVDTGAIYRTLAYEALEQGIDTNDGPSLAQLAESMTFEFKLQGDTNQIWCNGERVGGEIRTPRVSEASSFVSAHAEVREALLEVQRELGARTSSVFEGRDIGTVVFPNAEVKVFLTATPEERARRRAEQLQESGEDASYEEILTEIRSRDDRDTQRAAAPLVQADDAVAIDSTSLSIDAVTAQIVSLARQASAV